MFVIVETETFSEWLDDLKDRRARTRLQIRLRKVALGNLGDVRPVGGDKSSQTRDIERAIHLSKEL